MGADTIMLTWKHLVNNLDLTNDDHKEVLDKHEEYMKMKGYQVLATKIISPEGVTLWEL